MPREAFSVAHEVLSVAHEVFWPLAIACPVKRFGYCMPRETLWVLGRVYEPHQALQYHQCRIFNEYPVAPIFLSMPELQSLFVFHCQRQWFTEA